MRFHVLSLPTPDEKLVPVVGQTLDVVLGIADDKVLVAAGRDAAKALKKALDDSKAGAAKEVLPFQVSLAATPVAKFIAQVAADEEAAGNATRWAEALATADGKDHVTVTAQGVPQGVRLRLEVEAGVLKAAVAMSPLGGGMMGPMRRGAEGVASAARRAAGQENAATQLTSITFMPSTFRTEIAGLPVADLARQFGTPTFVYDAAMIQRRIADLAAFDVVRYAQKACSNLADSRPDAPRRARWSTRSARAKSAAPWPPATSPAGDPAADRLHGRHLRRRVARPVRGAEASTSTAARPT